MLTRAELTAIRREILRYARWLPPGEARNARRETARALKVLFADPAWLARNAIDDAPCLTAPACGAGASCLAPDRRRPARSRDCALSTPKAGIVARL